MSAWPDQALIPASPVRARINESLGDVANWDLLPQSAIVDLQLIPGTDPLFSRERALRAASRAEHFKECR